MNLRNEREDDGSRAPGFLRSLLRRRAFLAVAVPLLALGLLPAVIPLATSGAATVSAAASPGASGSPGTAYQEQYRPQAHFSPARNWMNDPNGLIYYKGQYNLFYQANPEGNTQSNLSWGHAVSTDLVHWKQLPLAIPFSDSEWIFSGSVVYDQGNTSGLGTAANPPLVAIYTSFSPPGSANAQKQAQSLAYSTDGGITWTKYSGNPVLDLNSTSFRDPKVFWYAPSRSWLMSVSQAGKHQISFYSSPDLKTWTHLSDFGPAAATGGEWECPDLFQMNVDGNPDDSKWVLVVNINPGGLQGGSGAQYFTGNFDGKTFTPDSTTPTRWLDYGSDYYAAATYNDAPDGQRIMIAWMNNWNYAKQAPTTPWRGSDAFPRELGLKTVNGQVQLVQEPIDALNSLHGAQVASLSGTSLSSQTQALSGGGESLDIQATLTAGTASQFGINVRAGNGQLTQVGYDTTTQKLYIDRTKSGDSSFSGTFAAVHQAPLALTQGKLTLRIIVDASSVEVFADQGEVTLTDTIYPDPSNTGLSVFATNGTAQVSTLTAWQLNSIWR
jgi:fructan beta-fructosidase